MAIAAKDISTAPPADEAQLQPEHIKPVPGDAVLRDVAVAQGPAVAADDLIA